MKTDNLTITLLVDQTPREVFEAILNVRAWWSEGLQGKSTQLHDEFDYRHKDIHYSRQRLIEVIPNEKVVWEVTESDLSIFKHNTEWTGTIISFEISEKNDKTQLLFTHHGLVPQCECFSACSGGWGYYVGESLLSLITTGKGQPDSKKDSMATAR